MFVWLLRLLRLYHAAEQVEPYRRVTGLPTSSPDSGNERDPAGEQDPSSEETGSEAPPGAIAQTTECPNCGRPCAENYCPSCGQELSPSASLGGVIGGFFRELLDVERGVWPTFVSLTLAPGQTVDRYLEGERKQFASPGRYLLLVVVVLTLVAGPPLRLVHPFWESLVEGTEYYVSMVVGKGEKMLALYRNVLDTVGSQVFVAATTAAGALLFAHLLRRLFGRKIDQFPEALATSAFLIGHVSVLERGSVLFGGMIGATAFPLSSELRGLIGALLSSTVVLGYIGWWGQEFGSDWRSAAAGALAAGWAQIEATLSGAAVLWGFFLWHLGLYQGPVDLVVIGAVGITPLFIHGAVEAWWRFR